MDGGILSKFFGTNVPVIPDIKLDDLADLPDKPVQEEKKGQNIPGETKWSGFDSTGLERAVICIRELNKSEYAKDALEIAKKQETTKQEEFKTKMGEYNLAVEQAKEQQIRAHGEENRKRMQEDGRLKKEQADYQDILARRRQEEKIRKEAEANEMALRKQAEANEMMLQKQEESLRQQEAIRRATIEHEMELRRKNDLARVEAEAVATAKKERENWDIRKQEIELQGREKTKMILESMQTGGAIFGDGLKNFLGDRDRITSAVLGLTMLAAGIYTAKNTIGVTSRYIEARIKKPALVKETSRLSITQMLKQPVTTLRRMFSDPEDALKKVVLAPTLESTVRDLAIATKNTRVNNGWFQNIMLSGPPGTGKTLFSKKLAMHSGMDYAVMNGGDVAPLGTQAVLEIDKLFQWANSSRRGVLLFCDEADAFFQKRTSPNISEEMRSALNSFLAKTGTKSKKFQLVIATNEPQQLDWAVNDRISEVVQFDVPALPERERLVRLYFDEYVLSMALSKKARLKLDSDFDYGEKCKEIAAKLDGFSGREIADLCNSWQAKALSSRDGVLTSQIMDEKTEDMLKSHEKKMEWRK